MFCFDLERQSADALEEFNCYKHNLREIIGIKR